MNMIKMAVVENGELYAPTSTLQPKKISAAGAQPTLRVGVPTLRVGVMKCGILGWDLWDIPHDTCFSYHVHVSEISYPGKSQALKAWDEA